MRWVAMWMLAGCAQPLVDDTFSPDQWARLRASMQLPVVDPCAGLPAAQCAPIANFGAEMFDEPAISGSGCLGSNDPSVTPVACANCHNGDYFIDTESQPDNVSRGATKYTKHNALSLVNLGFKAAVAGPGEPVFTWTGSNDSTRDVFKELALPTAMAGSAAGVACAVQSKHAAAYAEAFMDPRTDPYIVLANVATAFDAYERRLVSVDSPFDKFIAGDDGALTAQEKHGFEVFAGSGICIECHDGPLLTDLEFHNTGVPQIGDNVPLTDDGRFTVTGDPADEGAFLTPSLRNVFETAPYMHAGQFATLDGVDGVVAFYRAGGGDSASGTKDPRLVPLDISDDDAADLVAFLRALTGAPPDPGPY